MHSVRAIRAAALFGSACLSICIGVGALSAAPAVTPQSLAMDAYTAMGMKDQYFGEGTQALETVVTLTTTGTIQQWEPGESESVADLTKPDGGTSTFKQTWDRTRGLFRVEWTRPRPGGMRTYTEIYSPDGGYVIGNDANGAPTKRAVQNAQNQPIHTMSSLRLRALLREQERMAIVFAMHENPERISDYPAQTVGGKRYPAVQYRGDNGTFIVMFDPATKLPAIVRTRDFDQLMGDSNFDAVFSDWRPAAVAESTRNPGVAGALKLPFHTVYMLNGFKLFDTTVKEYGLNTTLATDAFTAPLAIRGKAARPAPIGKVPYQWILRRLASGFYLDSEPLYTDDGNSIALTDVAPNVSLATGSTHNTLIVATDKYLVAFDAPGDDGQSKIVMDLAKQKYPGKSFKYLVLTHHHIDHSGGFRSYAADGATLVVGKGDGAFFRKALTAPSGLNPYPVAGKIEPKVVEVSGKWSVNDGGRNIEAYSLDNPHAQGYLIPYVPDAKVGFVTDLWNPGPMVQTPANPGMVAVVRGVEKMGIAPEKFAGGHGGVGNYADLVKAAQ